MYDVAVVGAGVIGSAVARELMRFTSSVVLVEANSDVALGASKANSGIVHAGYDAPLGSLMSRFNVEGNHMYDQVCEELDIPFKRIGSLVLAFDQEQMATLETLRLNGERSGVPGLEIIDRERVLKMETNANPNVVGALYAPTCGIIEPWEIAIAYTENAVDNGCDLLLDYEIKSIKVMHDTTGRYFSLESETKSIKARSIVNCAGIYADKLYQMVNPEASDAFEIKPRRGQYYLLDKSAGSHVTHVLFPCPTALGKGTLVLPTVDGNLLVGPDSELLTQDQGKEAVNTTAERLQLIKNMADHLVQEIPYRETITTFSGLRAESNTGDFIVGESEVPQFYQAAGIKSPGLSSAPAIGKYMAQLIATEMRLSPREDFRPYRKKRIRVSHLSLEERASLIQKDPSFGRIICRCEEISEGEILDVIHRGAGATTVNGVKRRARPGAGRCQGGFCMPRVMEILSRELELPLIDIQLEGKGSKILVSEMYASGGQ